MSAINLCSFTIAGDAKILQFSYHCLTCSSAENQVVVCLNCAAICHADHLKGPLRNEKVSCGCLFNGHQCHARKLESLCQVVATGKNGIPAEKKRKLNDSSPLTLPKKEKYLVWTQFKDEPKQIISAHYNIEEANIASKKAFFDFNPWELSPDALRVTRKVAMTYEREGSLRLFGQDHEGVTWSAAADVLEDFFLDCLAYKGPTVGREESMELIHDDRHSEEEEDYVLFSSGGGICAQEKPKRKNAKGRKEKEKGAPKHPSASYMFFSNANRDRVLSENPGYTVIDISRHIGNMWKTLSPEEKLPYEEQAKQDRQRYQKEMEEFRKRKEICPTEKMVDFDLPVESAPSPPSMLPPPSSSLAQILAAAKFATPLPLEEGFEPGIRH